MPQHQNKRGAGVRWSKNLVTLQGLNAPRYGPRGEEEIRRICITFVIVCKASNTSCFCSQIKQPAEYEQCAIKRSRGDEAGRRTSALHPALRSTKSRTSVTDGSSPHRETLKQFISITSPCFQAEIVSSLCNSRSASWFLCCVL